MSYFYFAVTNLEVQSLLKTEVSLRYPFLNLSYSRPGFLTYKSEIAVKFNPILSLFSGECFGRQRDDSLKESSYFWQPDTALVSGPTLKDSRQVLIKLGPDEYWTGSISCHKIFKTLTQSWPQSDSFISRAYFKILQAKDFFDLPFLSGERVLELGCAPGGATKFLLEQNLFVCGIDPAQMSPEIANHQNFSKLNLAFELLRPHHVKFQFDWLICDINLPLHVVMKELLRIIKITRPKGILITLKIPTDKHVHYLASVRKQIQESGILNTRFKYLPAHRKEICLYGYRDPSN